MNFFQQQLSYFTIIIKSIEKIGIQDLFKQKKDNLYTIFINLNNSFQKQFYAFSSSIKQIGISIEIDEYEKRKLGIFNQLNFLQLLAGTVIPFIGLYNNTKFPKWAFIISSLPIFISLAVLWLNSQKKYDLAMIIYFILYPVFSSIIYLSGIDLGVEVLFILYGILSVFFLQNISYMIFSVSLSMISYFMLTVVWKNHHYQLEATNIYLYLFNQFIGIAFIFYGLFLIKKENTSFQTSILVKNKEIEESAYLLKTKTIELTELNTLKNKLFSVIAHDLKNPMYALRNLFRNIQQQNPSDKEIKDMLPDVINDLNYTTGLMENLLQWAKSQMQSETIKTQKLDISKMVKEVVELLHLQADAKQLWIDSKIDTDIFILADKEMINLVLRNLISNAIKFTPAKGSISIGVNEMSSFVEIFVKDNGTGINPEALKKINQNNFFSTTGTANESGTGLGLMLCKEFLIKNGGKMCIESQPGKGSIFSFTLPKPVEDAAF